MIAILLFILGFSEGAIAYPNFISFGYQSCLACHYNPAGGGPLTDYGRVVAATLISDRVFWQQKDTDEQMEQQSGFLFAPPSNDWARPQADFRELYMRTVPSQPSSQSPFITMEASAQIVVKLLKDDRLTFVADIGYAPTPIAEQGTGKSYVNYRSREQYVGYRFDKSLGVYVGLMDKVFGIRVPDHEAFSRQLTNLDEDDQTYGVLLNYMSGKWEIDLQPFVGNLVQEENLRQKGATTQVGYKLGETARVEASLLKSSSDYLDMLMYSVDTRLGAGKGYSLMFELGQVNRAQKGLQKSTATYAFMQNHFLIQRGFYTLLTVEFQQPSQQTSNQTYRFGPGLQYFMNQRLELRADIYDERSFQSSNFAPDNWTITAQLHLWL